MKKTLLTMIVVLTALTTTARNIWTGSVAINWGDSFIVLTSAEIGTIHAGDKLVFTYQVTAPDTSWPQFRLCDSSWNMMEGMNVQNGTTTGAIYITTAMENKLSAGAVVTGSGCTMTSIDLVEGDGGDYSHAVWIGECVIGNWSGWQQVDKSAFANAKVGQLLRIKFKNLGAGAYLSPRNPVDGWPNLSGTGEGAYISGTKQDYQITSAMLAELQANGMVVSGVNFTCTAVELWNADELKPLTLSVPVTNNWVFTDAAPSFTISVSNPYSEAVTAKAVVEIATDKMTPVTTATKSQEVAAGASAEIVVSLDEIPAAGIYHATASVNDDLARGFYFAVKPTEIVSAPDKQNDFDSYWLTAKEQLAATPINATLTEIPAKSTANRKVYLVEMQSIADGISGDPVIVRGYYAEPTDGKKHPVIMHYLGYDSGYAPGGQSNIPYCPGGDDNKDYAEFYLSTRGQSVNNRPAADRADGIQKDFTNTYGDWFAYQFGNKDRYYYRGAYMDVVRAIDFMATRETSDMDKLFAEGQSQGGALTVAAAALSGRTFLAIAPAITFMGDFPDYFDITSWPGYVAKQNQGTMSDAEMYAFLSYYDTKNLATNISCPYITSVGLQDNVCPPHTNLAPYNNVMTPEADKQVVFNPELQHQVKYDGTDNWNDTFMGFFKKYLDKATGMGDTLRLNDKGEMINNSVYNLQGQRLTTPPANGLYIHNRRSSSPQRVQGWSTVARCGRHRQ